MLWLAAVWSPREAQAPTLRLPRTPRGFCNPGQIAFILKQAEDGTPVAQVCRKAGISDATFYNWRKKYAGLMPSEMKRLKQLEEENSKLKNLVADLSLDKVMLQDVIKRKL